MAITAPAAPTAAPTPAIQRGDRDTFAPRVDATITYLTNAPAQIYSIAYNTYTNATEAYNAAVATAADRVQTGLDRTQTGLDRTQTGLDRTAVAQDRVLSQAAAASAGAAAAFVDSNPFVKGSVDATKRIRFEVDGLTAGAMRTYTAPNKDGTMALLDDVTTLSGCKLIASILPTAVAAIDLANVFSDTYEHYLIVLTDLSLSTGNSPQMRVIANDGTTVVTTSTYYGGGTLGGNMTSASNAFGQIAGSTNGGEIVRFSATIRVTRGPVAYFDVTGLSHLNTPGVYVARNGYLTTSSYITGFRLFAPTGAFYATGRINVYAFSKF